MPSRRAVLAAGGVFLTTGCLQSMGGAGSDDSPQPSDDSPTSSRTGHRTDSHETPDDCHAGFYVSADDIVPADDVPLELSDAERSLVADAVDGGVEVDTYAERPLRDAVYVAHGGAFYETTVTLRDRTEIPARVANLDWKKGRTAPTGATVVDYTDLPAIDRQALQFLVDGPEHGERESHPKEGLSASDVPVPYPDGTDGSRLIGAGTVWVRWNDRHYRVEVTTESETVTRRTFRVELTEVATSDRGFRQVVVDRYLVVLDDLPDGQRRIVEQAAADLYEECTPASKALKGLQERLSNHGRLPHPQDESWFVSFQGRRYALEITNWVE